jgi:hypothetical protein
MSCTATHLPVDIVTSCWSAAPVGTTRPFGRLSAMEDLLESAIDAILNSADGDVRQAMRAILIENVRLQAELNRRDGTSQKKVGGSKAVLH